MVHSVSRNTNTSCLWLDLKTFHKSNKRWPLMQFTAWRAESKGTKGAVCKHKHLTHANPEGWSFRARTGFKMKGRAASSHCSYADRNDAAWKTRQVVSQRRPVCCCVHAQTGGVCSVPENHQMAHLLHPPMPSVMPASPMASPTLHTRPGRRKTRQPVRWRSNANSLVLILRRRTGHKPDAHPEVLQTLRSTFLSLLNKS